MFQSRHISQKGYRYDCLEHGIFNAESKTFVPHLMDSHALSMDDALDTIHTLMANVMEHRREVAEKAAVR